jgi:two-component system LytT family response regulator
MKFTCLIVDDEPLARRLMASHVAKVDGLALLQECASAIEAGNFLRARKVDLIFLDIQMPEVTGLEFMRTVKPTTAVIFTTAHREFATDAFDLDVVDYLLKPISFERFSRAVNKFFERQASGAGTNAVATEEKFIYLKADRKTHKVPLNDIIFIESLDEYVKVHLADSVLVTRENITSFENSLSGRNFVRIHRSFIVNINLITTITADGIEIGKKQLPFGRAYRKSAMAALAIKDS